MKWFYKKKIGTHIVYNIFGIKFKIRLKDYCLNSLLNNNQLILKDNNIEKRLSSYPGININIQGKNNKIIIHKDLIAKDINITIKNDNCVIEIEKSYHFNNVNIVCVNGNGQKVYIGENTSFAPFSRCQITLDDSNKLKIGKNCMFSNGIDIWCTDGHTILDLQGNIINRQKNELFIGNHCWIGENVKIAKNAVILDNSIVGMGSVVTKVFKDTNVIIAGNPAQIVKTGINWDSHSTFEYAKTLAGVGG